ncbi:hypothetical protein [Maricaulis alexandrii]|uniref:hypothetical protein n=1 Tax=Maricaulis alexandrii TaxID=2570354 RepID=UPI001107EA15|nr:hypothetical protein [Maricaulis alexandrii]
METLVPQVSITLPSDEVIYTKAFKHVLGVKFDRHRPSRMGGILRLTSAIVLSGNVQIRNANGSVLRIHEGICEDAYPEGKGENGRWHTDAVKWAKEWPKRPLQRRNDLRIKLWIAYFAIIGDPVNLEMHKASGCRVCAGLY